MQNEIIWLILLITNFFIVIFAYRFFGKLGLYAYTAMAIIIANIQVMRTIEIFGLVTTLGNIIYGSIFLCTDILNENHGKRSAQKAVWLGFFILIAATIIMQIVLQFTPHSSDFIGSSLHTIFGFLPRIAFASLTAYIISQSFDVWVYNIIRKFYPKHLWLRNNLSTMTSQLIDNILFTSLAFIGIFELSIILQIFVTTYIMKVIVAALDTPFMYWAKAIKN